MMDWEWGEFIKDTQLNTQDVLILPWGGHSAGFALEHWDKVFKNELYQVPETVL
jgi:hypothetical protein